MARVLTDLVGDRYHRLRVVSFYPDSPKGKPHWNCVCDCGNALVVRADSLKGGNTKSCGCQKIAAATRHGHNRARSHPSATYVSWQSMLQRCTNPKASRFAQYGGRGISVCTAWYDFRAFLADMGERPPNLSLDRIDPTGNYSPENCRWADIITQNRNRRCSRYLTYAGETLPIAEWADRTGTPLAVLADRLRLGWDDAKTLTTPYLKRASRTTPRNPPSSFRQRLP